MALLLGLSIPAQAQLVESLPASLEGVGIAEHAGDTLPGRASFLDHLGRHVTLRQYFGRGKPVILSLNYSNCPLLCNLQLSGMIDSLRELRLTAGQDFDVVSISIDPSETTIRAAQSHQRYLQHYGRAGSGDGFHFLVGRQADIDQVARAVGFEYRYLRERREYSHPAVFVLCTPEGRISHYFYGVEFPSQTMNLALVEAGQGTIGTTWDRVLLYCLHYDSVSGQYTAAAWKLMRIGGLATFACLAGLIGMFYRRELTNAAGNVLTPANEASDGKPAAMLAKTTSADSN